MINRQFQLEVRREVNNAKKAFLNNSPYTKTCRHWNFDKVQLEGLENFIKNRNYMTSEEVEQLIRQNPKCMHFFNYCLDIVPNFVDELKTNGYKHAFRLVYENKQINKDEQAMER